ncbi:MAG TPA: PQQ-binding-like beta-propeller repeat protein, partial [Gemmatales bacterium]|nr:PQQ-binding-like beta-propeller repeat protein [Gemmatales bacterium]
MWQLLALCLVGLLPPAQKDWPLFRGDTLQTGYIADASFPDTPELLWKINVPEGVDSTAAIIGEVVYLGTIDGNLLALSLKDGKELWKYATKAVQLKASAAVKDGMVVIGDGEGIVHALDASTGQKLWTFTTQGEIISSANITSDNRVLVGSNDEHLYCLDLKTGKDYWKYRIEGPINGSPGIVDGLTFVAGCDGVLHVVKIADGTEVHKIPMGGPSGASVAIEGDRLYVGNMERSFLCIDWKKGEIVWEYEPPRTASFYSSAAIAQGIAVVGARDRKIHGIQMSDGKGAWLFQTRGRVDCSPIILKDRVYCPSGDGILYCLELK